MAIFDDVQLRDRVIVRSKYGEESTGIVTKVSENYFKVRLDTELALVTDTTWEIANFDKDGYLKEFEEQGQLCFPQELESDDYNYDSSAVPYTDKSWEELVELANKREPSTSTEYVKNNYYIFFNDNDDRGILKADILKIEAFYSHHKIWCRGLSKVRYEAYFEVTHDFQMRYERNKNRILLIHKVDIDENEYFRPKTITEEILATKDNPFGKINTLPVGVIGTTELTNRYLEGTEPFKETINTLTKKENNMRKTVKIQLFDNDKGLDVQYSLVATFENVLTEDDNATTIQELMMNEDIAGALTKHNNIRVKQKDLDILKRTGNKVNLEPVKLKQLTWVVEGVQI